jgi:hypothetical protein
MRVSLDSPRLAEPADEAQMREFAITQEILSVAVPTP